MRQENTVVIRTGCLSCRAQGIKCNPLNPDCQRYVSTRWSSNRPPEPTTRSKTNQPSQSWSDHAKPNIRSIAQTWQGTLKERQSLHFFSMISARELSGLLDSEFWQMMLLQAAQADNAIKHAVAAIGASHEHQLRRQASRHNAETDGLQPFALRQCNKAITALVKPEKGTARKELKRALTAAVLLACYQSVAENREGAVPHVVHARRLLEEYKQSRLHHESVSREDAFPINLDLIEPLVTHYEVQVGDYAGERNPTGMIKKFSLNTPYEIQRVADARVSLEAAVASLSVVFWNLQIDHSAEAVNLAEKQKSEYATWLQEWDCKFASFLRLEQTKLDKDTLNGCRLLKAHHLAISIAAAIPYGKGEAVWAMFTPQFRAIMELLEEILDSSPKKGPASPVPQTPYISATMGMTEPLYCVLSRCADGLVVETARLLVGKLPMNEGIHSEWRTAFVEKALCAATGKDWGME